MSHRALGSQFTPQHLRDAVNSFLDTERKELAPEDPRDVEGSIHSYQDPYCASGECHNSTMYFLHDSAVPGSHREWRTDGGHNHVAAVVPTTEGDHVVDFTFRQFDKQSEWPVIEPADQYEQRMQQRGFRPKA